MSETPPLMGVPVTHQRLTMRSDAAISAALDADSTICASSRMTRHHVSRVSGVGRTGYLRAWREGRALPAALVSKSRSCRSTAYVVSTMSASARSAAVTGMPAAAPGTLHPPVPHRRPQPPGTSLIVFVFVKLLVKLTTVGMHANAAATATIPGVRERLGRRRCVRHGMVAPPMGCGRGWGAAHLGGKR